MILKIILEILFINNIDIDPTNNNWYRASSNCTLWICCTASRVLQAQCLDKLSFITCCVVFAWSWSRFLIWREGFSLENEGCRLYLWRIEGLFELCIYIATEQNHLWLWSLKSKVFVLLYFFVCLFLLLLCVPVWYWYYCHQGSFPLNWSEQVHSCKKKTRHSIIGFKKCTKLPHIY